MIQPHYNYANAVFYDVLEYLRDNHIALSQFYDREEAQEKLYDDLWCENDITGNGAAEGYDTSENCKGYLNYNLDEAFAALDDFCIEYNAVREAEDKYVFLDSLIRLNHLAQAIDSALTVLENEGQKYESEMKGAESE